MGDVAVVAAVCWSRESGNRVEAMIHAMSVLVAAVMSRPLARFVDFMDGRHCETGTNFILSIGKVCCSYSSGLLNDWS